MIFNWIVSGGIMSKSTKKESVITVLNSGEKYIIRDLEAGSKAWVPIWIENDNEVEVVSVDKGLITGVPEGKYICDSMVFTVKASEHDFNITWLIELKGSKNLKEAKHSIEQIIDTITYLQDHFTYPKGEKYIKNRDYVFAAIAGAPDKTLPAMNNDDIKKLCRILFNLSGKRKTVKNMFSLFFYIRSNVRCKEACIQGNKPPYDIVCYSTGKSFIRYPSMLMKMIE